MEVQPRQSQVGRWQLAQLVVKLCRRCAAPLSTRPFAAFFQIFTHFLNFPAFSDFFLAQ
jgi:hypothetical protein